MKLLLEISDADIDPSLTTTDETDYKKRSAARAVVFDSDGKVALLRVGKHNYHKLPGGGIEDGEDITHALERELQEEIGCTANVMAEVGEVIEHLGKFRLIQTSYCFAASQTGEKGEPDFTESEIDEQFSIVWADSLAAAIKLLEDDAPTNYEGEFITRRDLALLKAAAVIDR